MRRRLILLVCASLSLVGVSAPAHAGGPGSGPASGWRPGAAPSAPRSLVATGWEEQGLAGRTLRLSWTPPASPGSSAVASYRVRITPSSDHRRAQQLVVPASSTRASFRHLVPGATYRVSVRAVSAAGRSRAARVRYAVPERPRAWVFAVDTTHESIVRVPVRGGKPTTVTRSRTAWTVDPAGDVYVVDQDAGTLSRTPAGGSTARVIASGFHDLVDVQLDGAGRVYVVDGSRVVRMSAWGHGRTVVAQPVSTSVFVRPDGAVSSTAGDGLDNPLQLLTYPPGGGRPLVRTVVSGGEWGEYYPQRQGLLGDSAGNLFLHWVSGGGSGFEWWFRIPAGSTDAQLAYTHEAYYAVTVDPRNHFYLAQTATFCDDISENEGTCTPDLTVDELLRYDPDGTRTAVPISPFDYLRRNSNSASTMAVDRRGRVFVAQAAGPSTGLLAYRSADRKPTVLARGKFTDPRRNG